MTVKLKLDLSPAAGIRSFAVGLGLSGLIEFVHPVRSSL